MEDNIKNLIDYYTDKKRQGLDFSEIRKELTLKNHDPETIKTIIKGIDNQILNEELNRSKKIRSNEIKIIGLILFIGGTIVTFATFLGIINMRGYFILAYGPILAGFLMIVASRNMKSGSRKISKKKGYFG